MWSSSDAASLADAMFGDGPLMLSRISLQRVNESNACPVGNEWLSRDKGNLLEILGYLKILYSSWIQGIILFQGGLMSQCLESQVQINAQSHSLWIGTLVSYGNGQLIILFWAFYSITLCCIAEEWQYPNIRANSWAWHSGYKLMTDP